MKLDIAKEIIRRESEAVRNLADKLNSDFEKAGNDSDFDVVVAALFDALHGLPKRSRREGDKNVIDALTSNDLPKLTRLTMHRQTEMITLW